MDLQRQTFLVVFKEKSEYAEELFQKYLKQKILCSTTHQDLLRESFNCAPLFSFVKLKILKFILLTCYEKNQYDRAQKIIEKYSFFIQKENKLYYFDDFEELVFATTPSSSNQHFPSVMVEPVCDKNEEYWKNPNLASEKAEAYCQDQNENNQNKSSESLIVSLTDFNLLCKEWIGFLRYYYYLIQQKSF